MKLSWFWEIKTPTNPSFHYSALAVCSVSSDWFIIYHNFYASTQWKIGFKVTFCYKMCDFQEFLTYWYLRYLFKPEVYGFWNAKCCRLPLSSTQDWGLPWIFYVCFWKTKWNSFWEMKVESSLNTISKLGQCHEERGMCERAWLPGMLLALKTNATSACLWAILHSIVVQMLFGSAFPNQC